MADAAPRVGRPDAQRLARMLGARSIAVLGASERPGSFGLRLATEALRSPASPVVHVVHPSRRTVLGHPCVPSLGDLPEPVDLVLLGIPDDALVEQVTIADARGDGGAVIFGSAVGLGEQIATAAGGLALCGAGCMGFINMARGVRAIGYLERSPLPVGGIAMVSHSGSVFSALLRTHRRLEFCLSVSSGQELVTTTADYLSFALEMPETRVVGLFLETLRDVPHLRAGLLRAAERDLPVVALTVGGSPTGRKLVEAHSGALAGDDAVWEALFTAYGVHRAFALDELVDSLEMFAIGRRVSPSSSARGIASVHDSGAERVLVADVAQQARVAFAEISDATRSRLAGLLSPGLEPVNPLDVWGTGADTAALFTECLATLAADESVGAVALAVDLVPEYDGDESYPQAVEAALERTDKPVVVLANLAAAVDQTTAARLRARGVPVLEGTWSGLRALAHLLTPPSYPPPVAVIDEERQARWRRLLMDGRIDQAASMRLLADYGICTVETRPAGSRQEAVRVAESIGFPVVLKTDDPAIAHKLAAGGVVLGLPAADAVATAYDAMASRLGPRVVVQRQQGAGVEVYVGLVRDRLVGPIVLVGAGGTLVEAIGQRRVALPPLGPDVAGEMVRSLGIVPTAEAGLDRRTRAGSDAVVGAVLSVSQIAVELGDLLDALDVNPLLASSEGAVAVDALVVARSADSDPRNAGNRGSDAPEDPSLPAIRGKGEPRLP